MNTTIAKILASSFALAAAFSVHANPSEPTGFGGIAWGASAQSVPNLIEIDANGFVLPAGQNDSQVKLYKTAGQPERFGLVEIDKAVYRFVQDKFASVELTYVSRQDRSSRPGEHITVNAGAEGVVDSFVSKQYQLKMGSPIDVGWKGLPTFVGDVVTVRNDCKQDKFAPGIAQYNCKLTIASVEVVGPKGYPK